MSAILIDTNVLIYAYDLGEFTKQAHAYRILDYLEATGNGRISVQCLAEFFSLTTRGRYPKLTPTEATLRIERFSRTWPVYDLTLPIILEATRGVREHQLSYYDSQVWATARLNQVPVILSEDFSSGATLESVHFVNPFAPDFVLEDWA